MKFNFFKKKEARIYLDYAAATPVAKEVQKAMEPLFTEQFGNPSAIHKEGTRAKKAIEEARRNISKVLSIRTSDVIFTSGGTESNYLGIVGHVEYLHAQGRAYTDMEVLTTRMEHPSVLETVAMLETRGVKVEYIQPDEDGILSEQEVVKKLSSKTVLITFAYVNSEIGVIQDVKRITRAVRKCEGDHDTDIRIHLDASQAPLWLPCQMDMLGIDMMTLDAGKCYGPKGVGVLARRHGVHVAPLIKGGGQEFGLRAGTENTALIVGCVKAILRAQAHWKERSEKVSELRDPFFIMLLESIPEAVINGSTEARVANNVNISIPTFDTEFAVVTLDTKGIAASTKSACSGASGAGSKVVMEITGDSERAGSTIRFTLGESTTKGELQEATRVLSEHITKMRNFKNSTT